MSRPADWHKPDDWPEPPPWIGYAMGVTGAVGLLVIGVVAGGEARRWLVIAAVCALLAVELAWRQR